MRNPKQVGTDLWDCIPQKGPCPNNCNQCFFNRPGAFYTPTPMVPTPEEVGDGIMRMNCGHDSNLQKDLVVHAALQYKNFFFNTAIPRFDFPGPVVYTANPLEEQPACQFAFQTVPANLMFVRLRVSSTNLLLVKKAADYWTALGVPVVLTFMAYYDVEPQVPEELQQEVGQCYEWRVRHINSYWCPTVKFMKHVLWQHRHNRLVAMCGSLTSGYCKDCLNCQTYYHQTMKRLRGE